MNMLNLLAHAGHDHHGFASGIAHPMGGADHVLAMVAVGLIAASLKSRWVWTLPLLFVSMMIAGGVLGVTGMFVPEWIAELAIAASVVALGLLVTLGSIKQLPVAVIAVATGVFGLFHGAAHGAESPAGASTLAYFAGFAISTIALHALGVGVGIGMSQLNQPLIVRITGGAMAACGGLMLAGMI
jgi:urease accessory protein